MRSKVLLNRYMPYASAYCRIKSLEKGTQAQWDERGLIRAAAIALALAKCESAG